MTLQERLNEAETALHELLLGKRVVKISRGGKTVDFTPADVSSLRSYINQLKAQVNGSRRGPMRVTL